MDSADSDHSISGGISIPQWMKSRISDRYEDMGVLSPPNQDDAFFHLPYSKPTKPQSHSSAPTVIVAQGCKPHSSSFSTTSSSTATTSSLVKKHTEPCLKFLGDTSRMDVKEPFAMLEKDGDGKMPKLIKSLGTDDGFKGEAAKCGHSVVQIAQYMIAERMVGRPSKLNTGNEIDKPKLGDQESSPIKQRTRRSSKSLPASPLSTPDSTPQIQRKNRFFTGAFVETSEEAAKFPGSWLVAGLLGTHRVPLSESQIDLTSDDNNNASLDQKMVRIPDTLRRNKSSSMLVQSSENIQNEDSVAIREIEVSTVRTPMSAPVLTKSSSTSSENAAVKHRPKPSELREMNFWSPTSM